MIGILEVYDKKLYAWRKREWLPNAMLVISNLQHLRLSIIHLAFGKQRYQMKNYNFHNPISQGKGYMCEILCPYQIHLNQRNRRS